MVRGEIVRLKAPRGVRGSEQRRAPYAIIVQADELLTLSTVLVAPTSRSAPGRSFRPTVSVDGEATRVLVEQTTAIALERLGDAVGYLSASELRGVDDALATVFDI